MARSVLGLRRFAILAFSLFAVTANAKDPSAAECAPNGSATVAAARQEDVQVFEKHVKSAPFYKELKRRFGPAVCKTTLGDGYIGLSFDYPGGAHLNATMETQIELTEQRVRIGGISEKSGIALLKKAEISAFGRRGCGIEWRAPAETTPGEQTGSLAAIYRGVACNCHAKLIFAGGVVVGLELSSAC